MILMSQTKVFNDFNIDNIVFEKYNIRSRCNVQKIKFDDTGINYCFQTPWFQSVYFGNLDYNIFDIAKVIFDDNADQEIFLEQMNKIDNLALSNLRGGERGKYRSLIRRREKYEDDDDEPSSVIEYMKFRLCRRFLDTSVTEYLEVDVSLRKTNIDGTKANEKIKVNNIEDLREVLEPYSNFRFIFEFKNLVKCDNYIMIKPIIHSIQADIKKDICKIYRGIESSSFECTICLQEDCTIKHKYKCCKKEVCYYCYVKWKNKNNKTCPYCRSKT